MWNTWTVYMIIGNLTKVFVRLGRCVEDVEYMDSLDDQSYHLG